MIKVNEETKKKKRKFFLIGSDGYSTTEKRWKTIEEAERACIREQKIEDNLLESGRASRMNWVY